MKRIFAFAALLFISTIADGGGRRWVPAKPSAGGGSSLLTNLVAYYKLDEASGNAVDATAGGRDLTIIGTQTTTTGVINGARPLDGSTQFFNRASETSFQPGSSSWFVTMWVKPSTLSQSSYPAFFSKWGNTTQEFYVGWWGATGAAYCGASTDGSNETDAVSSTTFANTTSWVFVAAGWDGTNLKVSVNGGAFTNTAFAGPCFTGSAEIRLGDRQNSTFPFAGAIDECAYWKGRCLTLTEVNSIYNSGAGLPFSSF